jgi:hypothetical protein
LGQEKRRKPAEHPCDRKIERFSFLKRMISAWHFGNEEEEGNKRKKFPVEGSSSS